MKYSLLLLLLTAFCLCGATFETDPTGTWRIQNATNPSGGSYTGKVEIKRVTSKLYTLNWQTSVGNYSGVGLLKGSQLCVGWSSGSYGVAVYTSENGRLVGEWATGGASPQQGSEIISLNAGSQEGTHTVNGLNPNGSAYTGSVTLAKHGNLLDFNWNVAGTASRGIGYQDGNLLVVGWTYGTSCGTLVYTFGADGTAEGRWAVSGNQKVCVENLAR